MTKTTYYNIVRRCEIVEENECETVNEMECRMESAAECRTTDKSVCTTIREPVCTVTSDQVKKYFYLLNLSVIFSIYYYVIIHYFIK
jgi:hypothetical protein